MTSSDQTWKWLSAPIRHAGANVARIELVDCNGEANVLGFSAHVIIVRSVEQWYLDLQKDVR